MKTLSTLLLAASLAFSMTACDLEFGDLNQPDLDEELGDPDPASIAAVATGLLVRQRLSTTNQAGYISELGIMGRESYVLDPADGRFQGELLSADPDGGTSLNPGNGAFGGNFWDVPYRTMQLGQLLLKTADLDATAEFLSAEEINALRGWALFHQAYALQLIVNTHVCPAAVAGDELCNDTDTLQYGAVLAFEAIDPLDPETLTPEALNENAPIVNDSAQAYGRVIALLDDAIAAFEGAGGAEFPFPVPSGFGQFNTPGALASVAQALKARAALYNDDMTTAAAALDASFLDETDTSFTAGMRADIGVFHNFSQNSGDLTNGLFADPDILAHPSLETDAELQADGVTLDARFVQKVRFNPDGDMDGQPDETALAGLASPIRYDGLYPSNTVGVPYIRNEELILIRAEVLARTGDLASAADLVNFIRENSGGLLPLDQATELDTEQKLLDEILNQRRYSLMFEGGHRWLDARRLGAVDALPLDREGDIVNLAWPVNLNEINAREILVDE
jgi:hypothetical protein